MSKQPIRPALQVRANEAHALVKALLDSGLSMNDIASQAKVSLRSVYRWLNEGRSPHPIWLDSLRKMQGTQGHDHEHQEDSQ